MTIKVTYNVTDVYMSQSVSSVYITVSYSDGGASGGGVWGSITGTLSNQTDLQNALDLKLDESTIDGGAEGQILSKASATDFDFAWINNYAKYLATNVRNQTGSTIGAFQVVYISGATGNKPLISLADADTEATSSKTYGVTATSIANNGTGDVVTAGELSGIDTSAFNEGDLLWLSTTAGGVVTSPPAEPAHAVFIGYVVRSHPTLGVIDVSIANGYELNELHGVQITTPTNNQGLFYNSTSTLWENKSITTALGYTPVPTTRNITINGVTYDLSADRTWTIAAGISGSGASGQVTYWTGASAVSGSNNLFWDNTNSRLGIGTNAPDYKLTISDNATIFTTRIINTSSTGRAGFFLQNNSTAYSGLGTYGTSFITTALRNNTVFFASNDFQISAGDLAGNGNLIFSRGANSTNETMRIEGTTGNVGINTNLPTARLDVRGDTLLRGSGSTIATTALTVQNSSSTNLLRVLNDGDVSFGADAMYWDAVTSRLGIGTNAPTSKLEVVSNSVSNYIYTTTTNTAIFSGLLIRTGGVDYMGAIGRLDTGEFRIGGFNATGYFLTLYSNNAERARLLANGNFSLGTTSDLGVRLGVVGDTILRGSGATSATTALTVQNSDNRIIIRATNNGVLQIGNINANSIYPFSSSVSTPDIQGTSLAISTNLSTSGNGIAIRNAQVTNRDYTSGDGNFVRLYEGYAPTSGTGTWQQLILTPTINQTGGANGITRGLYVAPTLTSAADFRAIETTSGRIVFGNLPTSSAGLPTGALWNDAGTVKIV